ncbi:MAG: hypothetical protein KAS72_01555 [Phycisphaerales bacterium]|nr:hypothetical protein [Phycisphaerales bacterium]
MRSSRLTINKDAIVAAMPLIIPIVALQCLRAVSGPAPMLAGEAVNTDPAPPIVVVRAIQPSDESLATAAWATDMADESFGNFPMYYPKVVDIASIDPVRLEDPIVDNDAPMVRLDGVMGDGANSVALIEGELLREGDHVAPMWTITKIDVETRTVTITHDEGREIILTTME